MRGGLEGQAKTGKEGEGEARKVESKERKEGGKEGERERQRESGSTESNREREKERVLQKSKLTAKQAEKPCSKQTLERK
jgi:hypothetical protein